ncbi:hypothetical protein BJ742DRAFT_157034 [Cladochytrium replicatum]|nr:hypothetical protein BJ742DRAFT_157034 [Cladochytrium replicatum]
MPTSRSVPSEFPSLPTLQFSIPSSTPMPQNQARNGVQVPQQPSFGQQFVQQQQQNQYSQQGRPQGQQQPQQQQLRPNFPSNSSTSGFSQAVAPAFSNGFANMALGQQQMMPSVNGHPPYANVRPNAPNGSPTFGLSHPQTLPDSRGFSEMQQQQQSLYGLRRPSQHLWQQHQQHVAPMLNPPSSLRHSSAQQYSQTLRAFETIRACPNLTTKATKRLGGSENAWARSRRVPIATARAARSQLRSLRQPQRSLLRRSAKSRGGRR